MKFLRFADNATKKNCEGLKNVFSAFSVLSNQNYEYFLPGHNISVDEFLTLWNGHLTF
jgi:hypothetical protein